MSQTTVDIVEGWNAAVDFRLVSDGSPQDLTGLTVKGQGYDRLGNAVDLTGDISVTGATSGRVRLVPDTQDFLISGSPYELRFYATANGFEFWPSAEHVHIVVRR